MTLYNHDFERIIGLIDLGLNSTRIMGVLNDYRQHSVKTEEKFYRADVIPILFYSMECWFIRDNMHK